MGNKELLHYFTDEVLPILDEIKFEDTNHGDYNRAQETLSQVSNKYKIETVNNNTSKLERNDL